MPLEFKISNPQVSDTGKDILIRDVTGVYNAVTNPGGYGFPNQGVGDIDLYHIEVSHLSLKEVYVQTQGRSGTPPDIITSPPINSIAGGGSPIVLTTYGLKVDDSTSLKTFGDGVYNIDVSVIFDDVYSGVGAIGDNYIIFSVPTPFDADVIYVGGNLYNIDKTKDRNGDTVLYLVQPLKSDVTSFRAGYKANAKVVVDTGVRTCMVRKAVKSCGRGCNDRKLDTWVDYLNSGLAFEAGDYAAANDLILSAGEICRGGCGC